VSVIEVSSAPDVTADRHRHGDAAERFHAIASTVEGAERAKLWDLMVKIYPPYVAYQNKTERKIPVVMLRRA
jgi:hypothetical protein